MMKMGRKGDRRKKEAKSTFPPSLYLILLLYTTTILPAFQSAFLLLLFFLTFSFASLCVRPSGRRGDWRVRLERGRKEKQVAGGDKGKGKKSKENKTLQQVNSLYMCVCVLCSSSSGKREHACTHDLYIFLLKDDFTVLYEIAS